MIKINKEIIRNQQFLCFETVSLFIKILSMYAKPGRGCTSVRIWAQILERRSRAMHRPAGYHNPGWLPGQDRYVMADRASSLISPDRR